MMRPFALVIVAAALASASLAAQDLPETNPFQGDSAAVLAGMGQFRQRCADCHGTDARGVRGPDITQVWSSGRTDRGLFNTVRRGVSNTEMPAFPAPRTSDRDIWQMLAYLRTIASPAPADPPTGDAETLITCQSCAGDHQNTTGEPSGDGPARCSTSSGPSLDVQLVTSPATTWPVFTVTSTTCQSLAGVQ